MCWCSVLIVVTPLWDWYEIPRLKASTHPGGRSSSTSRSWRRRGFARSWRCSRLGALTVSTIHKAPREISWLDAGFARRRDDLEGITAGLLIAIMLPALLALRSETIRAKAGKAAKKLAFLLPSSIRERRWWWLVCITAGICEEVVYRGFLLHYLHMMPWHLSLTWALVVSSVIFGIGHLYQGVAGAIQTAVIGFLFGALFVMTGSLLLPIVLHAVMDLRVLAMLPEGFETEA